ncbi:MAG TPA: alpha/beta fold hydrolase [Roseiflexaceae bacterium]|nr:alpha/beta fold hydrolase [Roseiflexaceae bacterium]
MADLPPISAAPPAPAEPFFERRGPAGVLLLHGYSGAPAELRPMGMALAEAGYTVHGPLLPGHGGVPADLFGVRWEDWADAGAAGLALLRRECERVVVVGFSMGGLLALLLAAREPVDAVMALAPALRLFGEPQLRLTGVLRLVMPWFRPLERADFSDPRVRAQVLQRVPGLDLDNPEVVARVRQEARIPVGSLYEIVRLQAQARRELPRVTAPLLLMQGRRDTVVQPRSVEEVARLARSTDLRISWFERSGHLLPLEEEREAVWATAARWLGARVPPESTAEAQRAPQVNAKTQRRRDAESTAS